MVLQITLKRLLTSKMLKTNSILIYKCFFLWFLLIKYLKIYAHLGNLFNTHLVFFGTIDFLHVSFTSFDVLLTTRRVTNQVKSRILNKQDEPS